MSAERERGGTFTFASLFLASMLLISAGLLVDASRSSYRIAAASVRQSELREGAFGGGTWATTKDVGQPLKGTLHLAGCKVEVEAKRDAAGRLIVTSRATNGIGESVGFALRYSAERVLEHFEELPRPTPPR